MVYASHSHLISGYPHHLENSGRKPPVTLTTATLRMVVFQLFQLSLRGEPQRKPGIVIGGECHALAIRLFLSSLPSLLVVVGCCSFIFQTSTIVRIAICP